MSLSMIIFLVIIPFVKESAVAKKELVWWHWKGISVLFSVMSIFLMASLTTCYAKSVIYMMSLDIIGEAIATAAKLDSVKVYWVVLWC